ncbi:hypothetical protein BJV78DRAFT_1239005 [Lactifluus subvellereus]|nr:hypothetical protein BJV78DRAFT_1239005 [Lactifluus subvellereus]
MCVFVHNSTRSRGDHVRHISIMYPRCVPCGRRSKSSTVWCALDLLTMRQRDKKKCQSCPVDVGFIRVIRSGCDPSIDCLFLYLFASSYFFAYTRLPRFLCRVSAAVGQGLINRWGYTVRNQDTSSKPIENSCSIYIQRRKEDKQRQNTTSRSKAK